MAYTTEILRLRSYADTGIVKAVKVKFEDTITVEGSSYTVHTFRRFKLPEPDQSNFIEFNNLTQSNVLAWISNLSDSVKIAQNLQELAQEEHKRTQVPAISTDFPTNWQS